MGYISFTKFHPAGQVDNSFPKPLILLPVLKIFGNITTTFHYDSIKREMSPLEAFLDRA